MSVNNQWVNREFKREIYNYLVTNKNVNTIYKNLWDTAKVVLTEKFIAIDTYIKKGRSQINNCTLLLQKVENAEKSSKEGNNKDQAEINEMGTRKTIQKINEMKNSFFEKINKIKNSLRILRKKRRLK